MCELLVMVRDKDPTGDPRIDCHRLQRGDVVVAVPDGHSWSHAEVHEHPEWMILKVPDMRLAEGQSLAEPEPRGDRPRRRHFHYRYFRLDLDHPEAPPFLAHLARHTAAGGNVSVEIIRAAHLRPLRRIKAPVADPDVIGDESDSRVIG